MQVKVDWIGTALIFVILAFGLKGRLVSRLTELLGRYLVS